MQQKIEMQDTQVWVVYQSIMLTTEQLTLIGKMYEDVQSLKVEVNGLKTYKVDSTAAIKALMAEKDTLVAELKLLKEANKTPGIVPGQPGMTGLFGGNSAGLSAGLSAPPATSMFNTLPTQAAGFNTPPTQAAGFSFPQSPATQGFNRLTTAASAAGKPTQSIASLWGTHATR